MLKLNVRRIEKNRGTRWRRLGMFARNTYIYTFKKILFSTLIFKMLRAPNSPYVDARTKYLLKVKTFHDDDALVIGHEPGKGHSDAWRLRKEIAWLR